MDDLDSVEIKLTHFLDNYEKLGERKYPSSKSIPQLLFDREILGPKCKKKILKPLEITSEKEVIIKKHTQISCQLGPAPKSTFIMVFSPNGKLVASIHGDHNIYVTNLSTGLCLHTLKGHPRTPWCVEFHPSSNDLLASGCLGGEVRVWDLKGGSEVWVSPKGNQIASLSFHPTDSVLAIATDNDIFFWNWTLKDPFTSIATKLESEKVKYVKFNPLGNKLITGIANVRTEGCTAPMTWRHPLHSNNLFSSIEHQQPLDIRVPYYSASSDRLLRPFTARSALSTDHQHLASDSNSDDSSRSRASEGSSSSSSSSLDSSSMASGVSRFSEWNARLSLLFTPRRNQPDHESDNSNGNGYDLDEINDDGQSARTGPRITVGRLPPNADQENDNARPAGDPDGYFRFPDLTSTSAEPLGSGNRNPYRLSARSARQPRPTGFHSSPLAGPRRRVSNFLSAFDDNEAGQSSVQGTSSAAIQSTDHSGPSAFIRDRPTTGLDNSGPSGLVRDRPTTGLDHGGPSALVRDRPTTGLDPLHSISLLSSHIENMQRICGSLDLARQVDPSIRNEHREITRLGQIRSMLIDIQSEIQSLRTAVHQTDSPTPETSPQQSRRSEADTSNATRSRRTEAETSSATRNQSVIGHHNYCISRPEEPSQQESGSANTSTARPGEGSRRSRREMPPELSSHRSRNRVLDNTLRTIRRRRFEREDSRAMRRLVDREVQSMVNSEFRHRIDVSHRRMELRAREYARFPEFFGEQNVPPGEISEDDDTVDFNSSLTTNSTTPRPRTFSLNNDTPYVPPLNRSVPDQRPNRLLEWARFARFRRLRNSRRTERMNINRVTSLSHRISRMMDIQNTAFSPVEPSDEPRFGLSPEVNVNQPGPSSGRQSHHAEELARLRSFRLVMTRLLQFVNELGSEVASSRLLDAPMDDSHGPPSDIELETLSFRGSFREAYRLTLRSLIHRIHNFIDNYLSEHGYDTIPTLEDLEEDVHYLQGDIESDREQGDATERNANGHAHNLRLLVRLALLLIRQLITFISAQHILNEERPISRLPNPFRDDGSVSSQRIVNEPEGRTLSNLLELVELTTDNILGDVMRRSNPGDATGEGSTRESTSTLRPTTIASITIAHATIAPATTTSATITSRTMAPSTSTQSTLTPSRTGPVICMEFQRPPPVPTLPHTTAPSTSSPSTSAPSTSAPSTSAPSTSAPSTSAPSTSAPSTSAPSPPSSLAAGASKRLTYVPRAQRLYCRRLSRPRARARTAGLSRAFFTEPPGPQVASAADSGGAGVVPEIVLNEAVDVNSNYLGEASFPDPPIDLYGHAIPPIDLPLRTFGGMPLRLLGGQNAVDRRSPDADELPAQPDADASRAQRLVPSLGAVAAASQAREARIFANRQSRQSVDQFMFYRRSNISSLASLRHIAGQNSFDAPSRPPWNNPLANSIVNSSSDIISHRLQVWDFDITKLPDLTDKKKNVILRRCKIHFDASVEVSADGTVLIALIPKAIEFNSVVVCSLLDGNLGEILFCHSVDANSICVSLSPTMTHLVIGVGSTNNRGGILQNFKQVVAYVYKLNKDRKGMRIQRGLELRTDHRLININCIKWMPCAGTGFIYGTNRGQLTILR